MIITFGEWAPDIAELEGPHLTRCRNVIPYANGYGPRNNYTALTATGTAEDMNAAIAAKYGASSVDVFAGGATKLYRVASGGSAFSDVSKVGGYTSASWDFCQYGNVVIAVAGGTSAADAPQAWTLGSSSAFADLAGSPPKAKTVATVGERVVMGYTYDATDGEQPARVRWCGFGDQTAWAISVATGADLQDLKPSGGAIQKITGGAFGTVFQRNAVQRMYMSADPALVYEFPPQQRIESIGCVDKHAAIRHGDVDYWLSQEGFKAWPAGGAIQSIGKGRIDAAALALAPGSTIRAAADPKNNALVWFVMASSATGTPSGYCYHITENRWTELYAEDANDNSAINALAPVAANIGSYGENLCILASNAAGGRKLWYQTGAAAVPDIITAYSSPADKRRAVINRVRCIANASSDPLITVLAKDDLYSSPTSATYVYGPAKTHDGRASGLHFAFSVTEQGSRSTDDRYVGVQIVEAADGGKR